MLMSATGLPSVFRKRGRPKWFQNASLKTGRKQWEKLIKSSPLKAKHRGTEKRKLREKVKKQFMSLRNSEDFDSQIPKSSTVIRKRGRPKKRKLEQAVYSESNESDVKKSGIGFFWEPTRDPHNFSECVASVSHKNDFLYNCSYCNFVTNKVNNIVMHFKYCSKKFTSRVIDYRVNDMDKRQRIRGEDLNDISMGKENNTDLWNRMNGSLLGDRDDNEPGCSTSRQDTEDYPDTDENTKERFGFAEKEIVWARVKKRFWPALLWELNREKALIYLISSDAIRGLKIRVDRLRSFDDAKWNKELLEEAKKLPNNDSFVVAVQMSNSYARKKFLFGRDIDPQDHFKIPDDVEFLSDVESVDDNDYFSGVRSSRISNSHFSKNLDDANINEEGEECDAIKKVMDCILTGKCNEHVLAVFNREIPSERHILHINKDADSAERLKDMSWFEPFERDSSMQMQLFEHLHTLFTANCGTEIWSASIIISYIYEVWIPEAIIKSISTVKDITLEEAEIIFYKQETEKLALDVIDGMDTQDL